MNKIHKLFPRVLAEFSDVCTDEIPNFIKEVEELNERCGTAATSTLNVDSSHTTIQSIHRLPAFKPLAKVALENAKKFAEAYGHFNILIDNLFIANMWFNVSGKDQYIFPHRHPGSLFSGAYYLESHSSHNITFLDTEKTIIEQPLYQNDLNADTKEFPCTPGTMYIFPSDFVHGVTRQMVDDRKIVISFNVCKRDSPELR